MKLCSLDINQFRCFNSLRSNLGGGTTIFHGDNAQGKTSILEAVCILLRLQSPRTSTLADCIKFGDQAFALGGALEADDQFQLRFQFRDKQRKLFVDGENQKRTGDYLRHSSLVVWMANDDLALIRGSGDGRRRFMDFIATQIFHDYRPALKTYEKALRSRNFLLKRDASPKWDQVDAYTQIIAHEGRIITTRRRELCAALEPFASTAQFEISGGKSEDLQLNYASASGEEDDLMTHLFNMRNDEARRRRTLGGPHLDDLQLILNGMPAAKFASEGQQRTVALSLKLAQTKLFIQQRTVPPILLIDDVFGELDLDRRNYLMASWPENSQKLITTTNLDWLDSRFDSALRMRVTNGELTV